MNLERNTTLLARVLLASLILTAPVLSAVAGDLRPPTDISSAGVLPDGIHNTRFKTYFSFFDEKLDQNGNLLNLADSFNRPITWGEVLATRAAGAPREGLRAVMNGQGLTENGSPGNITANLNVLTTAEVPVFAMGVTKNLTLALAVPIVHIDIKTATGFVQGPEGQKFVAAAASGSSPADAQGYANQLNDAINEKLRLSGYERVTDQHVTNIGDVHLISKYQVFNEEKSGLAVSGDVSLPTGTKPNFNRAVDAPTGAGYVGATASLSYDRKRLIEDSWGALNSDAYLSYGYSFGYHPTMHIRTESDPYTPDVETVYRRTGERYGTGFGFSHNHVKSGITLATGYHLQFQNHAHYSGVAYSPDRYVTMEQNEPSATLHSFSASANFSSVDFYRAGRFKIPFDASLAYGHILAGRNIVAGDVITAEMVLYF